MEALDVIHPDSLSVEIEERPDGSWLVFVAEYPHIRGVGPSIEFAAAEAMAVAWRPFTTLSQSSRDLFPSHYASIQAIKEACEDAIDARDADAVADEASEPWSAVRAEIGS